MAFRTAQAYRPMRLFCSRLSTAKQVPVHRLERHPADTPDLQMPHAPRILRSADNHVNSLSAGRCPKSVQES
jgi:hypothetical protein